MIMPRLLLLLSLTVALAPAGLSWAEEPPVTLTSGYFDDLNAEQAKGEQLREKLEQPVSCEFVDTPLIEAAKFLGEKAGIEIRIDSSSLEDIGLAADVPVNLSLQNVRLKTVLMLLRMTVADGDEIGYLIDGDRIIIRSLPSINDHLRIAFYPCADLLFDASSDGPQYDSLIHLLESCVAAYSWERIGGPAVIRPQSNGLVISQTDDGHEMVAAFLAAIREAKKIPTDQYDPAPIEVSESADLHESVHQALRATLTDVDFHDTALLDVVRLLSDQCKVQMVINEDALRDIGLSPDVAITDQWKSATAERILRDVLASIDATYVGRDGLIEITTPERLLKYPQLKLYPVQDLLPAPSDADVEYSDLDAEVRRFRQFRPLLETLTGNIAPESWEELGGDGVCEPIVSVDALAIAQTPENHRQIERLLATIRRERQAAPEKKTPEPPTAPVVISYPLDIDGGEAAMNVFAQTLSEEVAPGSWDGKQLYVRVAGNRLLVKQTPQTQRQVRRWLDQVMQVAPKQIPVPQGSSGGVF